MPRSWKRDERVAYDSHYGNNKNVRVRNPHFSPSRAALQKKNKFHLSHFISPNATWINEFRAPLRNIIHIFNETSERKWDLDSVLWEDQKTSHGG